MIKKISIIAAITIVGIMWLGLNGNKAKNFVNPQIPAPSETPAPPQAPKTFQFDSSTDLKAELEKVNPQVLDSDFTD